uniref:hypothetical protein n=1 Tax=Daedalea confragosa TaxID=2028083 RepID=UPI002A839BA3|nr:hypothetical protein UYH48_mgp12 [Daedaleopsis confragosa]WNZ34410.1 hypothetical protein [Daedaleopsis confragosa]
MRVPKIPIGVTAFGIGALATGVYGQHRASKSNQKLNNKIDQQVDQLSKQIADNQAETMDKLNELSKQNAQLQEQLSEAAANIKDNTTKNLVEFCDVLPTWNDITDLFYQIFNFGG